MKDSKLKFLTIVLSILITTGLVAASTLAFQGNESQVNGPGVDPEKRASVLEALDNSDYQAWLIAVGEDSKVAELITEEKFPRLIEAHNLMQAGKEKFEAAREIREELGLKPGFAQQRGFGHQGKGLMKNIDHQAIKDALDNNDYNAFVAAVGDDCPFKDKITEENFSKMIEAHNLQKEGNIDQAKEIMEEIGIKFPGKMPRFK